MPDRNHVLDACGWASGTIGLSGVVTRLAAAGWTPELVVSFLGALAAAGMTLVSVLKALWPYFDRVFPSKQAPPEPPAYEPPWRRPYDDPLADFRLRFPPKGP